MGTTMITKTSQSPRMGRALATILIFWIALWAVTIATWMYDDEGYAAGMPGPIFLLMMLGPLLVGFVLGWGRASLGQGMKAGLIGGVAYGLANMVAQLLWGLVLRILGRIPAESMENMGGFWVFLFEIVEFTLLFTITGLVLGLVGGLLGAALSRQARR